MLSKKYYLLHQPHQWERGISRGRTKTDLIKRETKKKKKTTRRTVCDLCYLCTQTTTLWRIETTTGVRTFRERNGPTGTTTRKRERPRTFKEYKRENRGRQTKRQTELIDKQAVEQTYGQTCWESLRYNQLMSYGSPAGMYQERENPDTDRLKVCAVKTACQSELPFRRCRTMACPPARQSELAL